MRGHDGAVIFLLMMAVFDPQLSRYHELFGQFLFSFLLNGLGTDSALFIPVFSPWFAGRGGWQLTESHIVILFLFASLCSEPDMSNASLTGDEVMLWGRNNTCMTFGCGSFSHGIVFASTDGAVSEWYMDDLHREWVCLSSFNGLVTSAINVY